MSQAHETRSLITHTDLFEYEAPGAGTPLPGEPLVLGTCLPLAQPCPQIWSLPVWGFLRWLFCVNHYYKRYFLLPSVLKSQPGVRGS